MPSDTPPPPHPSDKGPDNWAPYNNCVEFEVMDFLFQHNQMSGGDINFIFNLWAASLVAHDDTLPFTSHVDMYSTIDVTPLGNMAWQSFSSQYNGPNPGDEVPSWM